MDIVYPYPLTNSQVDDVESWLSDYFSIELAFEWEGETIYAIWLDLPIDRQVASYELRVTSKEEEGYGQNTVFNSAICRRD
jgi:hypothetical protein